MTTGVKHLRRRRQDLHFNWLSILTQLAISLDCCSYYTGSFKRNSCIHLTQKTPYRTKLCGCLFVNNKLSGLHNSITTVRHGIAKFSVYAVIWTNLITIRRARLRYDDNNRSGSITASLTDNKKPTIRWD